MIPLNPLMLKGLAGLALAIALVAGYFAWESRIRGQGRAEMKAEWDADNALRTKAENAAILQRVADNKALAETQAETNRLITRNKDAEITKIRADIANAPRMRTGQTFCGGSSAPAEASSVSRGDGANTGSRVLSAEMDRAVRELIEETERAAATGRAAQAFIRANGLAP